MTAADNNPRE